MQCADTGSSSKCNYPPLPTSPTGISHDPMAQSHLGARVAMVQDEVWFPKLTRLLSHHQKALRLNLLKRRDSH